MSLHSIFCCTVCFPLYSFLCSYCFYFLSVFFLCLRLLRVFNKETVYTLGNKCAKSCCKQTILIQLLLPKMWSRFFRNTVWYNAHITNTQNKNKCVSKMYIRRTRGCNTLPLFKGNISIVDGIPLSSQLKTTKVNSGVQCSWCIKNRDSQ